MKIGVHWLPHRRDERYAKIITHFLNGVGYRDDVCINIFCREADEGRWKTVSDHLVMQSRVLPVMEVKPHWAHTPNPNYMEKIEAAIRLGHEYSVKMDEDVFMSPAVWNMLFDSVDQLDDPSTLLIAPSLSNGIPTCYDFVNRFMSDAARDDLEGMFLQVKYGEHWGYDYTSLNKFTIDSDGKWREREFWQAVDEIETPFKGVHPVRMSIQAQVFINRVIAQCMPQFSNPRSMRIEWQRPVYFCDSLFAIKTEDWHTLLTDGTPRHGPFDEVALNLYARRHNLNMGFIDGGFAAHTAYGPFQHSDAMKQAETHFVDEVSSWIATQ